MRISEAIAACREPEELARTLADEIGKVLHFDHLYFVVVKENSQEIEFDVVEKRATGNDSGLLAIQRNPNL